MNYSLAHPLYVMLKPAGAHCNMACQYCYYLEKELLYPGDTRHVMSEQLLERFIREYIGAQTMNEVLFTWHGGETFMRPLAFYQRAMELQRQYADGHQISNCIQTNGTLITEEWARFLHDNNWLVGVSIDGPQEFHDEYRRTRQGKPTWARVMHGIDMLNRYGVEWNAMAVVNDFNAEYPLDFYHFFKEIGCHYIQFTPIVERNIQHADGRHLANVSDPGEWPMTEHSVTPGQWGRFLCTIFDEWVKNDIGEYFIQLFDATLANWMGITPGICTMARECGHAAVMEYNGDVYSCDHFVFPQYKLGNIYQQSLVEMMYGQQQTQFGRSKQDSLPTQCRQCQWHFACNGECPKNRFCHTGQGEPGLNYLCRGYQQYFQHVAPYMDAMKRELQAGRPASGIMNQ